MAFVPLECVRILSADDPRFNGLVRIYTESHPASERKPASMLAQMIQRPEYLFLVALQREAVVGFSITLCFSSCDAALLEYMAVDRDRRGNGVGQFLFAETVALEKVAGRYLIAEVDSDKKPAPDRVDRVRRKAFYRRLGCREIEHLAYIMPPVSTAEPPEMDLLLYKSDLPRTIQKSQLKTWLECCYTQVYAMGKDDPRIGFMIEGLPGEQIEMNPWPMPR